MTATKSSLNFHRLLSLGLGALFLFLTQGSGAAAEFSVRFSNGTETTLRQIVKQSQATCPDLRCPDVALTVRIPGTKELSSMPADLKSTLMKRAKDRAAQTWGDTVLEGPYQTNYRFRTEAIEFVELEKKVVGYRVTVSAPAWEIEKCAYDPDNKETLKSCPEGRILEAQFVSGDLQDLFADEHALAAFVPKARDL